MHTLTQFSPTQNSKLIKLELRLNCNFVSITKEMMSLIDEGKLCIYVMDLAFDRRFHWSSNYFGDHALSLY